MWLYNCSSMTMNEMARQSVLSCLCDESEASSDVEFRDEHFGTRNRSDFSTLNDDGSAQHRPRELKWVLNCSNMSVNETAVQNIRQHYFLKPAGGEGAQIFPL
jgi:hypothetical protein